MGCYKIRSGQSGQNNWLRVEHNHRTPSELDRNTLWNWCNAECASASAYKYWGLRVGEDSGETSCYCGNDMPDTALGGDYMRRHRDTEPRALVSYGATPPS